MSGIQKNSFFWQVVLNYRGPRSVCAAQRMDEVEYRAGLNWQMPDVNSFYYCRHRSMIQVIHRDDPSLTVRLSKVLCHDCVYASLLGDCLLVHIWNGMVLIAACTLNFATCHLY